MKSLKIIQVIAKVFRVLCIIGFVFCIVGASLCLFSLITFPILQDTVVYEDKTLTVYIAEKGASVPEVYSGSVVGLLSCGVGIFLTKYTELFLKEEIALGTPFDMGIVKKMRKVALVNIITSIALSIAVGIALAIIGVIFQTKVNYDYHLFNTILFGLVLLLLSLFCEYGAQKDKPKEEPKEPTEE